MIIEVVGKEIEKIKGDFESYLNGLNMVGEISYSQYSELYDEGTKQIQRAYELGKSELEKENAELKDVIEGYKKIAKWCDKCELEKKISILLSCKNCPENKGGLICQKEYEDKCLAQKIEFIKELQKENAELKSENQKWKDGIALKDEEIGCIETEFNTFKSEAKEIIERLLITSCNSDVLNLLPNCSEVLRVRVEAEQFLNSEVEK